METFSTGKAAVFFRFFGLVFVSLFVADTAAQWLIWFENQEFLATKTPYYSWGTYSADGALLSERDGILKLRIDPNLRYTNFPSQSTEFFRINSQGFRGPEILPKKTLRRIVLLGGSAAFGTGLERDSDTLAEHLNVITGAEVINAATIGYDSSQELALFVSRLLVYEPDVIIALNGGNDFAKSFYKIGETEIELKLKQLRSLTNPYFLPRAFSNLAQLLFPATTSILNQNAHKPSGMAVSKEAIKEVAIKYSQNEIALETVAKAIGAKLLVVIQPQSNLVSLSNGLQRGLQEGDLWTSALEYKDFAFQAQKRMEEKNLSVINTITLDIGLTPERFMDNVHLDSEGNRLLALKLAGAIGPNN